MMKRPDIWTMRRLANLAILFKCIDVDLQINVIFFVFGHSRRYLVHLSPLQHCSGKAEFETTPNTLSPFT